MIDFLSWDWPQCAAAGLIVIILGSNLMFHGQALRISDKLTINFHAPYASLWITAWLVIAFADGFFKWGN
jgi:hypothetical protein